jgi:UDP-glucose 4-epimerase
MNILITSGAGYIGSHTAVQVLNAGHDVVIVDSLLNSSSVAADRIGELTGRKPIFVEGNVRDPALLRRIFADNFIDAVIQFAGLKAVGESIKKPIE